MAFDAFIKIDGIDGESTDDKHQGWIEVMNCGVSVKQMISTTASSSGGASAERADFNDFNFSKQIDKSSPKLALACADGTHINSIIIEFCRSGTEKVKFMEYKLTNCLISEVTMIAGGAFPTESINLNYGKIEWSYTQQRRSGGGPSGNVAAGWDLEHNKKV